MRQIDIRSTSKKETTIMKTHVRFDRQSLSRRRPALGRRIRVHLRLALRSLLRGEPVQNGSQSNPRINPIRWMV
jgi:hypothetical protein